MPTLRLSPALLTLAFTALNGLPNAHAAVLLVSNGDTDTVLAFNASTGAFAGTFASGGGLDDQVNPKINAPEAKIEGVCTVARLIPRKTFAAAIPRETSRFLGETS